MWVVVVVVVIVVVVAAAAAAVIIVDLFIPVGTQGICEAYPADSDAS